MPPDITKPLRLTRHAAERCGSRGTTPDEVRAAIRSGQVQPVREGRWMFRLNVESEVEWQGARYRVKQVAPIVAEEAGELVVITVMTFFF